MRKTKLLIVHHRHKQYKEHIEAKEPGFEITSFDFREPIPIDSHDAEILFTWKFPACLLKRLPRLRWIALAAAGFDHLIAEVPLDSDIVVTRAESTMPDFIAEYVLSAILFRLRNMETILRRQAKRHWRWVGSDLIRRNTLGIIGLGNIGSKIAKKAKALGMAVYGASKSGNSKGTDFCDKCWTGESWREMLPHVDFLALVVPLTPDTIGMLGAAEFEAMKSSAVLINVSRGQVVKEEDLIKALREGKIGGAVLDVFNEEPLPKNHVFWTMDNVIVTPHVAGPSEDGPICDEFLENYRRWIAGKALLGIANLKRGY